jgi:hypothetical protein
VYARLLPRLGIAPQFIDFFFTTFSILTDLEGKALNNIITLSISLANDIINMELAGLVNRNAPPGMVVDGVVGSASLSFVCNNYPNSFIEGTGFDPDPANDPTLVIGCVNSAALANLITLKPPKDFAAGIRLFGKVKSLVQGLPNALNIFAVDTPTEFDPGAGFVFSCGDDVILFANGFDKVNQSPIPCVGVIWPFNLTDGSFGALNVDLLGNCQ